MTIARSRQISLQDTPYYHVVSRCVLRRAFLCGKIPIRPELRASASVGSGGQLGQCRDCLPSVCVPMRVMSNHYHLVLNVEVGYRCQLEPTGRWPSVGRRCSWPLLVRRWYQGNP